MLSAAVRVPIARTGHERWIQQEEESAVPFTRVPAKEAPRQRVSKAVSRHQTALTGNVPTGPVAAHSKKSRESAAGPEANLSGIPSFSASAFGHAITRELAALHG
jgi:hypothetical protein